MRFRFTIFLIVIPFILFGQNSLRKFNEINPALESGRTSNLVYRNIITRDAVHQYFHIHSERLISRFNLGLDFKTRTFDIQQQNLYGILLKGNYSWRITRKISITTGLGIGLNEFKKNNIVPGIGLYGEYFIAGYNTNIKKLKTHEHSVQFQYSIPTNWKANTTHFYKPFNNIYIHLIYLNYWQTKVYFNQYLCAHIQKQNILFLLGTKASMKHKLDPVFGFGVKGNRINFNFQTTLSDFEVTEMQISIKYTSTRLMDRSKRRFQRYINLAEI